VNFLFPPFLPFEGGVSEIIFRQAASSNVSGSTPLGIL